MVNKKCKPGNHVWNYGGECVKCKSERGLQPAAIKLLDDDDIPTTNGEQHPRGFWGNQTTGYRTDKENK